MNRLGYCLLASAFALGACSEPATAPVEGLSATASAPASAVDINETFTTVWDMFNPCNGEQIIGDARFHILLSTVSTRSGNTIVNFDVGTTFTGIGQVTALAYNGKTRSNSKFALGSDRSIVAASENEVRVTSQGSSDNFIAVVATHITITPEGTPTANHEVVKAICKG